MLTQQTYLAPSFYYNTHQQLLDVQYSSDLNSPLFIRLYHIGGKLLSETQMTESKQLELSKFPTGIYLIYYENHSQKGVWRLIKE